MSDNSETGTTTSNDRRRRGRRPGDAAARREAVLQALEELKSARVPFSMGDLAERAGISRATLYRDAGLRDLVGAEGDSPSARPVNTRDYDRLLKERDSLREERRKLRAELKQAEQRFAHAEARADKKESADPEKTKERSAGSNDKVRMEAYAEGFAAGMKTAQQRMGGNNRGGGNPMANSAGLLTIAARLPRPALLNARRTLARALHPDLYAQDPATALLATELLKQINSVTGGTG
jgi:hypothetical protein